MNTNKTHQNHSSGFPVFIFFSYMHESVNAEKEVVCSTDLIEKNTVFSYKSRLFTGQVRDYYENGNLKIEASFVKGRKEGRSTEYHYNGSKMRVSHFRSGLKEGKESYWTSNNREIGTITYKNGLPYEGNLIRFTYDPKDQTKATGYISENYEKGSRQGHTFVIKHHPKKSDVEIKVVEGYYDSCGKNGLWINYFINGMVKSEEHYFNNMVMKKVFYGHHYKCLGELSFKTGKPWDGVVIDWDEINGTYQKGYIENGKKHGTWFMWTNGSLQWVENYKHGQKHGLWTMWKNKTLLSKINYKDDQYHGKSIEYAKRKLSWEEKRGYLKGFRKRIPLFVKGEKNYVDGILNGKFILRNEKGIIIEKGEYKNNELTGRHLKYYGDSMKPVNDYTLFSFIMGKLKRRAPQVQVDSFYNADCLLDGSYKHWFRNGLLKEKGSYMNGHKDGKWIYMDENGSVVIEETWLMGELQDSRNYEKNSGGKLIVATA